MQARNLPVLGLLMAFVAALMLVPALQAALEAEWRIARGFLYPALFGFLGAISLMVLMLGRHGRDTVQRELGTLLVSWILLSAYACLPLWFLTPQIGFVGAWFEMIAALTTTGGSVYTKASSVPEAIHLWRGLMGWFGGLITLLAAYVILAPRRLGGFEVIAAAEGLTEGAGFDLRVKAAAFESRLARAIRAVLPVYLLLTLVMGLVFNATEKTGVVSAVHAMSIVSTSGISPLDGGFAENQSYLAEAFAACFMVLAATRLAYPGAVRIGQAERPWRDPELILMLCLVLLATAMIVLRHWVGVLTIDVDTESLDAAAAVWGAFFTALSFVTTTGFESHAWASARDWSGLENPGLVLLCLCTIGGGAATTAGGIKLIRAYALIRHGQRELERIAVPLSVAGQSAGPRGLRRDGAFIAWAFMMLFFMALLLAVLGLTFAGMPFADALIAAIAAISNTGPAFASITDAGLRFSDLGDAERIILGVVMVLGRVETLAVIALFNPDAWARTKKTGNLGGEAPLSKW